MNIYLAARYGRREELCGYRRDLRLMGHEVPARWLDGKHQAKDDGDTLPGGPSLARNFAEDDLADLLSCHCLIAFPEAPRSSSSRGGRHVEFGMALGLKLAGRPMRILVVGPRENVFHCLPEVEHYATWSEARAAL